MSEKNYLNRFEVAKYLGVSIRYIDILIKEKSIPFARLGKRIIFSKGNIDKWLDKKEVKVL
tara:strand:+ start:216 stop:398 length:183 start_codon:yes stop_codon:yes gene_type:complete